KAQSVAGQTCVAGDGENTAGSCILPLNALLDETNLENDLVNGAFSAGTIDPGANRLVAAATDQAGNRAFKKVVFTMGGTAVPGVSVSALLQQSAMDLTVQNSLKNAVMPSV